MAIEKIKMVSGFGQFHTNEPDPKNPKKQLTPYKSITWPEIQAKVDNPPSVDKAEAQWVIPSILPTRSFKEQEAKGEFPMLWADLDKNPPPLSEIGDRIEPMLNDCDFELYSTRSATEENQKARLLVPVSKPLSGADRKICQEILNDKLGALGIIPDRSSERAGQLCYLPNRGKFYDSDVKRNECYFDPMTFWAAEIAEKRQKIEAERQALEEAKRVAMAKKEALAYDDAPDLIGAFNLAYTPHEILQKAGYDQRGNSFRHPNSSSGSYSATVKQDNNGVWRVHALSTNDPLYSDGAGAHDAFSTFETLLHNGDRNKAMKDAGDNLLMIGGLSYNRYMQQEWRKKQEQAQAQKPTPEPSEPLGKLFPFIRADKLTEKPIVIDWLLESVIERGSLNLLFGDPAAGKSLFALDWAFCVAAGMEWHEHRTKQADVVIVAGEGFAGMARRLKALETKYRRSAPASLFISERPAQLIDPNNAQWVADSIKATCSNPGLIIVDTLHRNMEGDENSSQDIGRFIANLDAYLKPLGCSVLIVHHSGHGQKERSRGSSSIRAAMDGEFSATRTDSAIVLSCHKAKDFEAFQSMSFSLEKVEFDWFDEDGEPLTSVFLEYQGEAVKMNAQNPRLSAQNKEILACLNEAIAADGIEPPDEIKNLGTCRVVHLEHWREKAYKRLTDKTPDAKQKAFKRSQKKLLEMGKIAEHEDYCWPA